jgi:hypothetical protein
MKLAFAILLISFRSFAAPACEVYGISDSPQAVTCTFGDYKLEISCRNGVYQLNDEPVEAAYHMEVEEGPVPLVFKSKTMELTVNLKEGRTHQGILSSEGKKLKGKCRL